MKTSIRKLGDSLIVTVAGTLSHDSQAPFREQLIRLLGPSGARAGAEGLGYRKVIFDFDGLDFVGSSGITSFAQLLREFGEKGPVEYRNLQREFKRVFLALDESLEQFFCDDSAESGSGRPH